jgi:ribosomal protein S18 acetylase RimI-like enzyme
MDHPTSNPSSALVPLAVWLEPGYEGGRVGAWARDLPGAFAAAPTPERALSAILTTTARVREWLEAHGDDAGLGTLGRVEIEGEVGAVLRPDGYEVNATFPWDRRRLAPDEAAIMARRLGWLLADMQAVLADIDRFEAAGGILQTALASGAWSVDQELHHLGNATAWFAGRLDGAAYAGPLGGADPRAELASAQAWAVGRVRALAAADDGAEVTDEHGETWTLAKVVRRLVYHAFEHVWDLDRRLARADGTGDRVDVRLDRRPDAPAMAALLRSVGWDGRAVDPGLGRAILGTPEFAAAWDGDRLVGTARSLTDGAMYAHIATVVVHPRYQGLGVGERLMHLLMDGRDGIRFGLSAAPGMDAWYRKLGYEPDGRAMMRPRGRN